MCLDHLKGKPEGECCRLGKDSSVGDVGGEVQRVGLSEDLV